MKTKLFILAFTLASALLPVAARAEDEIDFNFFYENLSPYGEWIQVGDYGNCWVPSGVDDDWAPYTDGYWSYTDAGWTWVSYEDFGDITYHYGRWVRADDVGWAWVPDYEWGPAWVSWREEEENIGWAPLPPEARWNVSVGFSTWSDDYYDIGPSCYNFVPVIHFGAPVLRYHCLPRVAVFGCYGRSRNITNICWNPGSRFVFCGGPRYGYYNSRLARPIPTFKIVQNNVVNNYNTTVIKNKKVVNVKNKIEGNTLRVFSPKVAKKTTNELNQPTVTRVVAKDKVNKGWRPGPKDQGVDNTQFTKLREKVRDEAKTTNPEKAPARPVEVADLEPVPKKADPKAKSPVADRVKRPVNGDDKPNKIAGPKGDDKPNRPEGKPADEKPNRPETGVEKDKPNKVAEERPNRGPAGDDKPNRVAVDRPDDANPVKKPFRQQEGDDRNPEMKGKGKVGGNGPDNTRDNEAEQRQRVAREQQEKQINAQREAQRDAQQRRAAEMQNDRQRNAVNEARQRQAADMQAENAQRQRAQQQAIQAQRQQQVQRQAELQQRQMQLQRQQQQARQQPPQGGGGGQRQGGGQGQPQGSGQGQAQGGGGKGKGQLSPEELQQLRKQQQRR